MSSVPVAITLSFVAVLGVGACGGPGEDAEASRGANACKLYLDRVSAYNGRGTLEGGLLDEVKEALGGADRPTRRAFADLFVLAKNVNYLEGDWAGDVDDAVANVKSVCYAEHSVE
jgi:hypothetical protein